MAPADLPGAPASDALPGSRARKRRSAAAGARFFFTSQARPHARPSASRPAGREDTYSIWHEVELAPGDQYTVDAGHAALVPGGQPGRGGLRVFHPQPRRVRHLHRPGDRACHPHRLKAASPWGSVETPGSARPEGGAGRGHCRLAGEPAVRLRHGGHLRDQRRPAEGVSALALLAGVYGRHGDDRHDCRRLAPWANWRTSSAARTRFSWWRPATSFRRWLASSCRSWWELLAARFIGGLAIGGTSVVTPMYIAEISPPRLRGRLVMINQLNIVLGIFLCFISNYVIACHYSFEVAWRWMLGVLAFPSVVFFLSIFWILESPRSLVKRGRLADARRSLGRLGEDDVEGELAAIQASLADRPGHVQERLFRRPHWRPLLLCFAVAVFNQLTGINAILYYTPEIFSKAGAGAKASAAAVDRHRRHAAVVHHRRHVHHRSLRAANSAVDRIGGHDAVPGLGRRRVRRRPGRLAGRSAAGAGRPDRLDRLLCHVAGGGHVRVHLRDLPQRGPRQGPGLRHPRPLGHGHDRDVDLPGPGRVVRRRGVRLLCRR